MKALVKTKEKKENGKKKGVNKPKLKKEQVLHVAQEIKFVRKLSGNDKKTRDRMLKALKNWIAHCFEKGYDFKEEDFTRVWKGLFYAVWMSDKPLIQEELCDNISGILDLFLPEQLKYALLMTKAGLKKLATEWYGIDQHRMDKFLMLVRRYLRGSLRVLERCGWTLASCQKYAKMLSGTDGLFSVTAPHYVRNATSMLLHFADCFLEELAKVSKGELAGESVAALLQPFLQYTCSGPVLALCTASRRMLTALLRQSEIGIEYEEKTRAWKMMGCPAGGPDALEPASDDEEVIQNGHDEPGSDDGEDTSVLPLDPRAGRVDVVLPLLPVPARALADMLASMLATASSKAHRRVKICLHRLEMLAEGQYPLPVSVPEQAVDEVRIRPTHAARALTNLEHKLKGDTDELKLRGLSRKHKKRLLRKTRAGLSIVEDVEGLHKPPAAHNQNGDWLVESEEKPKKLQEDTSNKENQEKTKKNKISPQKRKNDAQQNGEVSSKKRKLDKTKNNLNNSDKKKNKLLENKKHNVREITDKKKNNLAENNKKNGISKKDKKANLNKITEEVKLKEVKTKAQNIKSDMTKEVKTKKPKTQLDVVTAKIKDVQNTKNGKLDKESAKKPVSIIKVDTKKAKIGQIHKQAGNTKVIASKAKNFQKALPSKDKKSKKDTAKNQKIFASPKKVKFQLDRNSMQQPIDYYKSVRQSPNIPFDGSKKPVKTNLKPCTPSPLNPFAKKLRMSM